MEIVWNILKTVAKRKVVNEEPTIISTEALDALVVKLDPVEVAGSLLTLETGSVQLPDSAALRHLLTGAGDFVDIEVLLYDVSVEHFMGTFNQFTYTELSVLSFPGEVQA